MYTIYYGVDKSNTSRIILDDKNNHLICLSFFYKSKHKYIRLVNNNNKIFHEKILDRA